MAEPNRPSLTALITASCFTGGNLAVLAGGGVIGLVMLKIWWLLGLLTWGATGAAYMMAVVMKANDPRFIEQVAREDRSLPPAPSAKALEILGGAGLTGLYLEQFTKVKQLKGELVTAIGRLPEGPAKETFSGFLPQLDDVTSEVLRISTQVQRVEKDLGSGIVKTLDAEIAALESKVAGATDPSAKGQLEQALSKKKQARSHYDAAAQGIPRTQAQIESIVAAMQEARARVTALEGRLADPEGLSQAHTAVEGISREVKYLTQAVEDTVKLLN